MAGKFLRPIPMTETWTISVGGRVYGPYSLEQMRGFHGEGRLAAHSLIARSGEDQFHPAQEDPDLAALLGEAVEKPAGEDAGEDAGDGGAAPESQQDSQPETQPESRDGAAAPHRFGRSEPDIIGGPSHYVIITDMKSRAITGLEEEIFNMGPAHRFMPQAWVLTSEATLNTIRNRLVQKMGKIDTLFIVDAAHDRAAWFNFGPENDSRMRRSWSRPQEFHGTERRSVRRA